MSKITRKSNFFSSFWSKIKKWLIGFFTIFFILILIFFFSFLIFQEIFAQKIYPGVKIGNVDVGGKTPLQALKILEEKQKELYQKGLKFYYQDKEISISPIVIAPSDPDLSYEILSFDWKKTIFAAYQNGRNKGFLKNILDQLQTLVYSHQVFVNYNLNQQELENILKTNFSPLEKPAYNAQLKIENGEISVGPEQIGYVFNYPKTLKQLSINLTFLDFSPIELFLTKDFPKIKKSDTPSILKEVEEILKIDPITLKADSFWWKVHPIEFSAWLEFQLDENNQITLGFSYASTTEFLTKVAEKINVKSQDAKFKLAGNRVIEFQASRDGKELDILENYKLINKKVIKEKIDTIDLIIKVTPAKITTGDVNEFGIKELIGVGRSNFSGSPKNRRHNIAVGAKTLNGILIKPGEEFSLLKALGPVDSEHGYLPELVIKGDRTIPEYGGGLCQIGTTTFRVALRSGLPITQRQNHSYRVVYYEPAGMDATIYNPYPDMRFLNDTGHYILFTTRIEGDDLIFEFYGTKDDRKIEISPDPPKIYNITSPGLPRYIETEELKPGEKKLVERAHKGADTYFKYTVVYPKGEKKEQDFYSHYVAWPEVWLVGKEPEKEATTTQEFLEIQKPAE